MPKNVASRTLSEPLTWNSDGIGPVRLELISVTPYPSGVVWLPYRPVMDG